MKTCKKVLMKTCKKCLDSKEAVEFPKNKAMADGLDSLCKLCMRAKNKEQYAKHAEKRRAYALDYMATHKEEKSEYNKAYRAENSDALNEYVREWRKTHTMNRSEASKTKNKARMKELYKNNPAYRAARQEYAAAYRETHRDEYNQYMRERYNKNRAEIRRNYKAWYRRHRTPAGWADYWREIRVKHRAARQAYSAAYHAKRYESDGKISNEYLNWLHKWQDHCCFYCNVNLNGEETIEHIVSLKRDGTNYPYNVVLACGSCNFSKSSRIVGVEWDPEFVHPAGFYVSRYIIAEMAKRLRAEKIPCLETPQGFEINGVPIIVLSSFWMGNRAPSLTTIDNLRLLDANSIFLFDHEWRDHSDAIVNVLKAKAGLAKSIGARKLELASPNLNEAREFMNRWHIQGFMGGSKYLGLRDEIGWHAMASFREYDDQYELTRMTFKDHIGGGLSRIIQGFRKISKPKQIFSYADLRYGSGNGYLAAGFTAEGETRGSYMYANGVGLFHRTAYTKEQMAKNLDWFDAEKPERELAKANGLIRIDGLPQLRFILKP